MTGLMFYICKNVGVSGTTPCVVKERDDGKFEARMGFAMMGCTNMDEAGFRACEYNPFHEDFYDNYATGVGDTEQEAVDAMKAEMSSVADSLWM